MGEMAGTGGFTVIPYLLGVGGLLLFPGMIVSRSAVADYSAAAMVSCTEMAKIMD